MHESYHTTIGQAIKKYEELDKDAANKGENLHAVITQHPTENKVYLYFASQSGQAPALPEELEKFIAK